MDDKSKIAAQKQDFAADLVRCWQQLPNKGIFLILFFAWLVLFQFLGNGTFGYINTPSLFSWMLNSYTNSVEGADGRHLLTWFNGDDFQGLLMPPIVLALLIWKRKQLLALPIKLWWPGLLMLAVSLGIHVGGYLIQQPRISIIGLFAGIYSLIGLAWGPAWLRASFLPFCLFVFCIPFATISEPVTLRLRLMVSYIVAVICNNLLGMDVVREGTQLFNSLHTYRYEVAAACSGLRSFMAIFALSTIYGFISFEQPWKRLLLMSAAFPLAVIGNVLRMLGIIITAEVSGQSAGNFVHENSFFSLIPYVPAILGIMFLVNWLDKPRFDTKATPNSTVKVA
jgi:exosortase